MKKINVKKLVALAAGAALVGTALAPMATAAVTDLEKTDVYDASGSPIVNVVVGSTAAASDFVWAGNIARKVVEKAVSDQAVAVAGAVADTSAAEVAITVGGITSVSGAKRYSDSIISKTGAKEGEFTSQTITKGSGVPALLYYPDKSYVYNNTTYTTTMQEKLGFTADVWFDALSAKGLVASISQGDMDYIVDLGSGIPIYDAAASTTAFSDGANDNIRIPFLGEDYLVKSVSVTSAAASRVELVKSTAEKEYLEGDKIEGLLGKDGGEYYIVVGAGAAYSGTNKINLSIFDSEGNQAAPDVQVAASEEVTFYNDDGVSVLDTTVTLSTLGTTTAENTTIYKPFFLVGSDRVLLYNNNGYPYDSTLTTSDYDYWVTLTTDSNKVTMITVDTTSNIQKINQDSLKPGESVSFMNDYATLTFEGLQLAEFSGASKNERTTGITIGGGKLQFKDSGNEITQTLPFFIRSTLTNRSSGFTKLGTSIAGKDIYARIDTTDVDINLTNGDQFNGISITGIDSNTALTAVSYTDPRTGDAIIDTNSDGLITIGGMSFAPTGVFQSTSGDDENAVQLNADGRLILRYNTTEDSNSTEGLGPMREVTAAAATADDLETYIYYTDDNVLHSGIRFEPQGSDTLTYRYAVMVNEWTSTQADLWLMLAATDESNNEITTQYSKKILLTGTDIDEDMLIDAGITSRGMALDTFPYYLPHSNNLPTRYGGGLPDSNSTISSTNKYVAHFFVDDDESGGNLSPGGVDFNVYIDTETGKLITVGSGSDLSTYTQEVTYDRNQSTTSVTKWQLSEHLTTKPTVGYSDFGTKVTVSGGVATFVVPENVAKAEILISSEGTATTATGGEDLTVAKGKSGSTSGGTKITITDINGITVTGGADTTAQVRAPLNNKAKVMLDTSATAGPAIAVGGHKVNKLTAQVEGVADQLNKAGDKVVTKSEDGVIVVAGYLGTDTGAAAQELITWLDGLE